MSILPLPPQDRIHSLLSYDPGSGIIAWKSREVTHHRIKIWNQRYAGKPAGSKYMGYLRIALDGSNYLAHRIIWKYMTGDDPENHIDHKNGNPSDNRFSNLRLATNSENHRNRRKTAGRSSKYKGVHFYKNCGKWGAYIKMGGDLTHLGFFEAERDAAKAYDVAASKHFGEFSRLNFPDP